MKYVQDNFPNAEKLRFCIERPTMQYDIMRSLLLERFNLKKDRLTISPRNGCPIETDSSAYFLSHRFYDKRRGESYMLTRVILFCILYSHFRKMIRQNEFIHVSFSSYWWTAKFLHTCYKCSHVILPPAQSLTIGKYRLHFAIKPLLIWYSLTDLSSLAAVAQQ